MAGAACKVIINNGLHAVNSSLEQILTAPWVRQKIGEAMADGMLQQMADLDLSHYLGASHPGPRGGLRAILYQLVQLGILTDEIWGIFNSGGAPTLPGGKK